MCSSDLLMGGFDIPIKAVREYIRGAIDLVINIERMSDGRRKVTSISEIEEIRDTEIVLKEIFAFKQKGLTDNNEVDGEFILFPGVPRVYNKIRAQGISDVDDIFFPEKNEKKKTVKEIEKSKKLKNQKSDKQVLYYEGKYEGLKPKEK